MSTNRRTDRGRFADGTIKVVADMSAEERFIARSYRIRKKLLAWMSQNVGHEWDTMGEMHRDAGNYCNAAMNTVARWIYQFTGPGQLYQIVGAGEDGTGYALALRGPERIPTFEEEKAKEKTR